MNDGLQMLRNAVDTGLADMTTVVYAGAGIIILLVLRMVKVSLDNAGHRARLRR